METAFLRIFIGAALVCIAMHQQEIRDEEKNSENPPEPSLNLYFINEPAHQIDFSNNTGKRIECKAALANNHQTYSDKLTINWTFSDGTQISNIPGLRQVNTADGSLHFSAFSSEQFRQDVHAAVYRCIAASNNVGTIVSRDVKVRAVMDVEYDASVYDVFAIRGNTAVIKCHIPSFLQDFVSVVAYIRDDSLKIASSEDQEAKYSLASNGALYIRDVGNNDAGSNYRCQTYHHLTRKMRISSSSGKVFVTDPHGNIPPRVADSMTTMEAKQGDNIFLPCVAHGYPLPITRWYVKDKLQNLELTTSTRILITNNGLRIKDIRLSDAGTYICHMSNAVGTDQAELNLLVTAPLDVKVSPKKQKVNMGGSLTINCRVDGHPISSIKWLKNGEPINPAKITVSSDNKLKLDKVSLEDKGLYQCFAQNDKESVQSSAQVGLGEFRPMLIETFKEAIVHQQKSVSFICSAIGNPKPEIQWSLDAMQIVEKKSQRIHFEKSVLNGQVKSILKIFNTVVEDGGVYTCSAINEQGKADHSARLNIYGPLSARKVPGLNVIAESTVSVNCPFFGYPIDKLSWEKDSIRLPLNIRQRITTNGSLMINNVQRREDSGEYKCIASNKEGQTVVGHIQVAVLVRPKITPFTFQEDLLREGMRARIQCVVSEGDTPITIKWTKDDQQIPLELPGITVQNVDEYSSILAIGAVGPRHNGNYTCVAMNAAGRTMHSAKLFVNAVPKIIPFAFQDDQNFKGMRAHIICAVSQGDLPLTFNWLKDGRPIETDSLGAQIGSYDRHSSSLSVDNVGSKHSGNYTCIATNQAGQATFTAQLVVQVAPKVVPFSFQGDHMFEGVLARVSCVVYQGDLPITIQWSKDDQSLDQKPIEGVNIRNVDAYTSILTIDHVMSRHSGNYSCLAKNSASSITQTAQLVVQVPPKIVPFSMQSDELVEGMFLRVSCVISRGDLPLSISWTKDGQNISQETGIAVRLMDDYSSVILIDSVKRSHSGNYTCMASNAAATTTYTSQLKVHVPPRWIKVPELQVNVITGVTVTLECIADGFPEPKTTWIRRNSSPDSPNENLENIPGIKVYENGTLIIKNVTENHDSVYYCVASNGIGTGLSRATELKVKAPIKIVKKSEAKIVQISEKVTLQCFITGNRPMNTTWTVNSKPLPKAQSKSKYSSKQDESKDIVIAELNITKMDSSDAALYGCIAENQFSKDEATILVTVQSHPNPPKDIKIVNSADRIVELTWQPTFDGHSPITKYHVEYKEKTGGLQTYSTISKTNSVVLENLVPAVTYVFTVYSENKVGRSETGTKAEITLVGASPSGPPESIKVQSQNGKSVRVSWMPPPKSTWNGNIRGYYVGYRRSEFEEPFDYRLLEVPEGYEKGLSFTLTDLDEFTRYSIVLQAFNDHGKGPLSEQVLVMTSEGVPSQAPLDVDCSPSSSQSIVVSWQSPPQGSVNGILRGYKILFWTSHYWDVETKFGTSNTTTNKATLPDLYKYSNYSIQVLAYTLVGDGVASKPIYCRTLEDVPSAPKDIKALPSSSSAILVTWSPPTHPNGLITHYTIYMESISMNNKGEIKHILQNNNDVYEVRNLKRNHNYRFRVTATTQVGEGPSTKYVEASPALTSSIVAQCAAFGGVYKLQADKPLIMTCPAVGIPTPRRSWRFRNQPVTDSNRISVQPDGSLQITSVQQSDTGNYTCSVINAGGQDEMTYTLIVKVPPSATTLLVTSTASTSISLHWMQPSGGNTPILGYTLHIKQEFGNWQSLELQPYLNFFKLSNLQCGTSYQLYLVAHNEIGDGKPSDTVTVLTNGGVPNVPSLDKLLEESIKHVIIHLDSWTPNGCPILYYVVEYKAKTSRSWSLISNNLRPEKPDLILNDLQPGTRYNLRMTAHTSAGSSVAEYDFSTMDIGEDEIMNEDNEISNPTKNLLNVVHFKVLVPIAICIVIIVICVVVTCLWVTRKRETQNQALGKKKNKNYKKRHSQQSGTLAIANEDSDDEISPYAMVKLSDFHQNVDASGRSLCNNPSNGNNKTFGTPNYHPTAPPMSESYGHGSQLFHEQGRKYPVLGPQAMYTMPQKDIMKGLRNTPHVAGQICPRPFENVDEESTFIFPPPPPPVDNRDTADYDPPPPDVLQWLKN